MKYLFAAIDARQGRVHPGSGRLAGRPKHNVNELKQLLVEANDGVDEKTSTHDFVDTLERIVNEIKNTTDHSGAFLQKVKKSEVPDYYDFIKKPMDLATLMKRVKSQMYRNKKSFADDLDLIWSNCLLYNSHPTHPLRRSAEFLRQKSNQLLEFISDPSLPKGPLYVPPPSNNRGKNGTPAVGGDDDDAEGDAEGDSEEDEAGVRQNRNATTGRFGMAGVNQKLINGINGDGGRDSTASPSGSRASTPIADRSHHRKLGRGPLGRNQTRSPSPEPPTEIPFEERPAIIRTPTSMHLFTSMDHTLTRFESTLSSSAPPIASTSSLGLIEAKTFLSSTPLDPLASTTNSDEPPPHPPPITTNGDSTPATSTPTPLPPASTTPITLPVSAAAILSTLATDLSRGESSISIPESPESLWWQSLMHPNAVAAGVPDCPFKTSSSKSSSAVFINTAVVGAKGKGLANGQFLKVNGGEGKKVVKKAGSGKVKGKGKSLGGKKKAKTSGGLGAIMGENLEQLNEIRKLHRQLGKAKDQDSSMLPLSDEEDEESSTSFAAFADTGVPASAFRTELAAKAGAESLGVVTSRVLGHTGFDGASAVAVGVLAHVAAEYLINFGRTLRFYSDRYGSQLSPEQIVVHALSENGVDSPSALSSYVTKDIDQYGSKLSKLKTRLQDARRVQLEGMEAPDAIGEEVVDAEDAFALGSFNRVVGEDFFGLKDLGIEKELRLSSINIPSRLLRGNSEGPDESGLKYPPPPRHVPLTVGAIDLQIGLLRPLFHLRETTEARLTDDAALPARPKLPRNKVPPSGRIPVKAKRKPDEIVGGGAMNSKTKRKKTIDLSLESEG